MIFFKKLRGQTLIEVLLALTIGTIVITGITSSVLYSLVNTRQADDRSKINHYLQEGMEVARIYRSRPVGTYCLAKNQANLNDPDGACAENNIDDKYRRSIQIISNDPSCEGNNKIVVKLEFDGTKCEKNEDSGKCEEVLESCANVDLASGQITSTPTSIPAPSGPYVEFTDSDDIITILTGQSANIAWSSKFASNCTTSGEWGTKPVSVIGSESTGPKNSTGQYTYNISCTSAYDQTSLTDTLLVVVVNPTPIHSPTPTRTPTPTPSTTPAQSAFNGVKNIPGTIQAEDFDNGGSGVAYSDTTAGNSGDSTYRTGVDVDLFSRDGGVIVGTVSNGEWLEYTTNITGGTYDINFRTAASVEGRTINLLIDGQLVQTLYLLNTGNTSNYQTFTMPRVNISGGSGKVVRFELLGGNFNLNWVSFTASSSTPDFWRNISGQQLNIRSAPAGSTVTGTFDRYDAGVRLSGPTPAVYSGTNYDWYRIDSPYDSAGWIAETIPSSRLQQEAFPWRRLTVADNNDNWQSDSCTSDSSACDKKSYIKANYDLYVSRIACNSCNTTSWSVRNSDSTFTYSGELIAQGTTSSLVDTTWREVDFRSSILFEKDKYYEITFRFDSPSYRIWEHGAESKRGYIDFLRLRPGTGTLYTGAYDIRFMIYPK